MNIKHLVPMIAVVFASTSHAAGLTTFSAASAASVPGASIAAVITIPTISLSITPSLTAQSLPLSAPLSLPAPIPSIIAPARLPTVPSPLPLPERAILAHARRSAPSTPEHFVLDWSFLDGDDGADAAPALVPVTPGPKPLPPAGAMNELRDLTAGREPIRVESTKIFDGKRESLREIALPHDKFF